MIDRQSRSPPPGIVFLVEVVEVVLEVDGEPINKRTSHNNACPPPDSTFVCAQAEVMLQIDGKPINKCTCFMYLDSTPNAMQLLDLWKQEIVNTAVSQNQVISVVGLVVCVAILWSILLLLLSFLLSTPLLVALLSLLVVLLLLLFCPCLRRRRSSSIMPHLHETAAACNKSSR